MASAHLERCATGRLARAYPAAAHDVEIRTGDATSADLRALADEIFAADPRCRRVVHAVPAGNEQRATAARDAGFCHVVDVDLPDAELELWIVEPAWVTTTDIDLDRVPGS